MLLHIHGRYSSTSGSDNGNDKVFRHKMWFLALWADSQCDECARVFPYSMAKVFLSFFFSLSFDIETGPVFHGSSHRVCDFYCGARHVHDDEN